MVLVNLFVLEAKVVLGCDGASGSYGSVPGPSCNDFINKFHKELLQAWQP